MILHEDYLLTKYKKLTSPSLFFLEKNLFKACLRLCLDRVFKLEKVLSKMCLGHFFFAFYIFKNVFNFFIKRIYFSSNLFFKC